METLTDLGSCAATGISFAALLWAALRFQIKTLREDLQYEREERKEVEKEYRERIRKLETSLHEAGEPIPNGNGH